MTNLALGRRPPKAAPSLRIKDYLRFRALDLTPPVQVDHFSKITDWGLYENDRYGVCGPTAVANMRKMMTLYVGGSEVSPTQDDVFALYRLQNPQFDPNDPGGPGDGGVDLQTMCENLISQGIGGVKALAFAAVDIGNMAEVRECVTLFGGVLLGVNLDLAQEQQTGNGQPWSFVQNSPEWGGHAVLFGAYDMGANYVITWAQAVPIIESFIDDGQLEEAWVVIWPENLTLGAFQRGVDLEQLAADYKQLTGRDFNVSSEVAADQPVNEGNATPVTEAPAPVPAAAPADAVADFFSGVEQQFRSRFQNFDEAAHKMLTDALAEGRQLVDGVFEHANRLDAWLKKYGI